MTTSNYTEGDEIPLHPPVRSAWDAVKHEVTALAFLTPTTTLLAALSIKALGHNPVTALSLGLVTAGFGFICLARAVKIAGILQRIPAPNP